MRKTAETSNFRLVDICRLHMQNIGNTSIRKSDTRLKTPVAKM